MKPLCLTLRNPPPIPLDASPLRPDLLAGMSTAELLRVRLRGPRAAWCLGDLFTVAGDDPAQLVIEGDCRLLHRVGAEMSAGQMRVIGDVGDAAGQAMRGGQLTIEGSAGDEAGQAMRGGQLRIAGDVGDRLATPARGERSGMSGGLIVVGGDAGALAGHRMRRGLLMIAGAAGQGCAAGMVAGTIAVGEGVGAQSAVGMRRGTLLLARPAALPSATFGPPLPADALEFLGLLLQQVVVQLPAFAADPAQRWQRSVGDRAVAGLGEVIAPSFTSEP